jgi:hypothetical protein
MRVMSVIAFVFLLAPGIILADFTLLDADFDDKTVDFPIGLGGADSGEPLDVDSGMAATVRYMPFASPCLEIKRTHEGAISAMFFEFADGASINVGNVTISFDVILHNLDSFNIIDVCEQGYWSSPFCNIFTSTTGSIHLVDAAGYHGIIGSFLPGQIYNFQIIFDMFAGTYDVLLDGTLIVEDRSHGKTGVGIGRQVFSLGYSSLVGSGYCIDNLKVMSDEQITADISSFSELKLTF